ncbi:MAG: peroxide stress protein YaaA [Acidimicrobiales bacterium]
MSAPLLVLVPPSEAKTPGGTLRAGVGVFDGALGADRRRVIDALLEALENATTRRQEIMLNARGPLLERALVATRQLADERVPRLAAWQRYSGVVWSHLGPATLTPAERRRLLVPSSLYGVTSAEDRIADFRLKMNVGVGSLGTMATYWRPRVTTVLAQHARRSTIVNLLPLEHEAAIDLGELARTRRVLRVEFIDGVGGTTVGHDAKAVKGVLARTLLVEGLDALTSFEWQGWRSVPNDGVFRIVSPAQRELDGWVTKKKKA